MKFAVTTTSTKLTSLLSEDQLVFLERGKEDKRYDLTIHNLGDTNIYIENGGPAVVGESNIIPAGMGANDIVFYNISRLELISETSINDNIRIITT